MNEKLIKVGKMTLATIMASSMSLSVVPILPVLAEELESPVEQTVPVEDAAQTEKQGNETLIEKESTETTPTQDVEDSQQTLDTIPTVQESESTDVIPMQDDSTESSLPQSTSFATGYSEANTVDELKVKLDELIKEAEQIWTEKGGYDYFKNNVSVRQSIEKTIPKAKEYLAEGKSTAMTFSWRCYEMNGVIKVFNDQSNVLTEQHREVYALVKERDSLNSSEYTTDSWNVYTKAVDKALATANGSGGENRLPAEIQAVKDARDSLVKVDKNLLELKTLVSEVDAIIQTQQNPETSVNYSKESWSNLTVAYSAAMTELNKNNATIDVELFNTLKTDLINAKNGLVIISDFIPGQESGVLEDWKGYQKSSVVRGGKLFVSNEVANDDGTTTITVKWINDGTDPFTGGLFHNQDGDYSNSAFDVFGEWSLRPITKNDLWRGDMNLDVIYTYNGETVYDGLERLTDDQALNGFEATFVVPSGASVKLKMGQWNGKTRTFSLGTYYTQVPDTVAPVISVSVKDVKLTVGDKFDPLKYVTAVDDVDGDLTKYIEVSGDMVDTTKAGTYKVTYTVTDAAGNIATETITVTVNPKIETINAVPTIKAEDKTITVGDKFDPMKDVTATDKEDGDITENIKVTVNKVDTTKPGAYLVTYEVSDKDGAKVSKTITVTVKDAPKKPVEGNKPDKDKDKGVNTGVSLSTGLFTGMAGLSALGVGVLETLKHRKK